MNKLITIKELSEKLGMTVFALQKKVQLKQIPYYRLGSKSIVRFDPDEIKEWLASKHVEPVERPWKKNSRFRRVQ